MSDIDGMDAFNRVLDEMIDAKVAEREARSQLSEAVSATRSAIQEASSAKDRYAAIDLRTKESLPKLKELYEAADAIPPLVGSSGTVLTVDHPAIERLKLALKGARDYCDVDIPF